VQVFRFFLRIYVAVDNNGGASADHRQILNVHQAVVQNRLAADRGEVKAGGVKVSEVQGQIARQRLQREQRK